MRTGYSESRLGADKREYSGKGAPLVASTAQLRPGFFGAALRRRWKLLVVGTLLGVLAGVGAAWMLPTTYTSQASLILNPVIGNPFEPGTGLSRTDELAALQTEVSLVTGADVAELAVQNSTLPLPDSPEANVTARSPSNSQVLQISFSAARPEVAEAGAQAFALGYLDYRRQQAEAAYAAEAEQLQVQVQRTSDVIEQTADDLALTPANSSTALLLRQQLEVYASQLAQLTLQLTEVTASVPSVGEVITPATTSEPAGFPWWAVVAGGTIAGLALALMAAFVREHADGRVHDADELTAIGTGHPLAVVPIGPATLNLRGAPAEGFRLLHAVVVARHGTATPVVCVLGTRRSPLADSVGAGLIATAHRMGRGVLLVSSDWPKGWTEANILTARAPTDRLTWRRTKPGTSNTLAVLPLGDAAATESLVLSPAMAPFLDGARANRDLVVLSGGSSSSAISRRLATLADLTVIAVELGVDQFDEVVDTVESLRESGVEHIGLVAVTRVGRRSRRRRRSATTPQPAADQRASADGGPPSEPAQDTDDPDSSAGRRAG